jgi:hypothetical protein
MDSNDRVKTKATSYPKDRFYRLNWRDLLLVGAILVLSVAGIAYLQFGAGPSAAADLDAMVYQEGRLVGRLRMNDHRHLSLREGRMIIETGPRGVRVARSDCPRQICVAAGWVRTPKQVITCVPNRVLVRVRSRSGGFLDAVVQ